MRYLSAIVLAGVLAGVPVWLTAGAGGESPRKEKIQGYAEWKKGDLLVVDGQRVQAVATTRFKGRRIQHIREVPLGDEVEVRGVRDAAGIVIAESIEVKPNGSAMFEGEVRNATDQMEAQWLQAREVRQPGADGQLTSVGKLVESGPDVQRVQRVVNRLRPPYVSPDQIRVHVVDTKAWNAMAMGNGAVWVFTGLLRDLDDDELAIVVGHELAHYTHEHSRRGMRRAMWAQLLAVGVTAAAAETVDSRKTKEIIGIASLFSMLAWKNGYGRDLEDQADRVGMRYAYEGGFDVRKGPGVWQRVREKQGQESRLQNFFLSEHSLASVRQKNLEREIALNYATPARPRR